MSSRKYPCRGRQLRWRPCWTRFMRSFRSFQCWPISEEALVCLMVPTLSPHALVGVLRWKWIWSISNKMLTGKNRSIVTTRPPCNFARRSARMDWLEIQLEPVRWEAGEILNHGRAYKLNKIESTLLLSAADNQKSILKFPCFSHLSW